MVSLNYFLHTKRHDKNAIAVKNVMGEQVGFVEKTTASCLAPLVDKKLARLDGIIPSGENNHYKVCVYFLF